MTTKRFILLALGSCLMAAPASLPAQQDQSVVEAARKARADRKSEGKPKIVIDDDTVGNITGTINIVGQEPPAPADETKDQTKSGAAEKNPKAQGEKPIVTVKDEAYWRDRFAGAYRKLADDQHELDIMQREYNLKQQQYYADPNATLKQEYTRQDLNDSKAKIDDKTTLVAQDKQDIGSLQDELRQAGGDPGWGAPPSPASPSQPQQ